MENVKAVILAAGEGTRMSSPLSKLMDTIIYLSHNFETVPRHRRCPGK